MSFEIVLSVRTFAPGGRLHRHSLGGFKDGWLLANGLNPTERTILVGVSSIVALVISIVLHRTGVPPVPLTFLVYAAFALPLVFGAQALHRRGALFLSGGLSAVGVALLLFFGIRSPVSIALLPVVYLGIGLGLGWHNERRGARRAMWHPPRSLKDRQDEEVFEPAFNILHFVDREGMVKRRNEASRASIGHVTKQTLPLTDYVHPREISKLKAELIRLFDRGEIRGIETRFVAEDRTAFPVEIRGTRLDDRTAVIEARNRSR
ncbi:hypothetical protein KAT59_04655, partial [Candidatus Bipolaricaulota bacterium]|nr:hypothetical protein [Candidatus Bipolaricaulota bacterium]